jgi:hypothetical protein
MTGPIARFGLALRPTSAIFPSAAARRERFAGDGPGASGDGARGGGERDAARLAPRGTGDGARAETVRVRVRERVS